MLMLIGNIFSSSIFKISSERLIYGWNTVYFVVNSLNLWCRVFLDWVRNLKRCWRQSWRVTHTVFFIIHNVSQIRCIRLVCFFQPSSLRIINCIVAAIFHLKRFWLEGTASNMLLRIMLSNVWISDFSNFCFFSVHHRWLMSVSEVIDCSKMIIIHFSHLRWFCTIRVKCFRNMLHAQSTLRRQWVLAEVRIWAYITGMLLLIYARSLVFKLKIVAWQWWSIYSVLRQLHMRNVTEVLQVKFAKVVMSIFFFWRNGSWSLQWLFLILFCNLLLISNFNVNSGVIVISN